MHNTTPTARNVLGTEIEPCSLDPLTGFFRDGCCNTDEHDRALDVVSLADLRSRANAH